MRREDMSWLWCEHHNASTPYATDSCWFAISKDALRKTATPCRLVEFDVLARAEGYVKADVLRAFLLDARGRLDAFLAAIGGEER